MSKTHIENVLSTDGLKSLAYNRAWRQIQAIDATGITTFSYDEFGSLTNETVGGVAGTNTIERYYDGYGRSLGYGLNGVRQTTLSYDPATGRLSSMLSDGSSTPFEWSYLPGSDLKSSLSYPNGLTASWVYDANGQLLQVCNAFPTNVVSQYDYTYDAAGRRSERYHSGSAFATADQIYYDYNERSELTNAVASVDASYNFAYNYDDIGNRMWSVENMNETAYTANNLNQYTAIEEAADTFVPQFDADGNQTLIKTKTGIWTATYNGENRPIHWSNGATNIVMSFDRMGRRVQYLETTGLSTNANNTFTYDNYLCIARHREQDDGTAVTDRFIWDPTEPIATRPLVFNYSTAPPAYYTHDGNKNVSELMYDDESVCAHYAYDVFGGVKTRPQNDVTNPFRFSSEFFEASLNLIYYNYRHYNPIIGRWQSMDAASDKLPYCFIENNISVYDILGEKSDNPNWKNNPKLKKDKKEIKEPKPRPVQVVKSEGLTATSYMAGDVLGRVVPPPPHSFDAKPVCATVRNWRVVLLFTLTIQIEYVPKGVLVTLPDGTKMKRSSEGVERTIKHEKEHASHFKSAFEEIWSLADAERGGYGVDMSREEAERISKAISTKLHNRGAYNIIWENKVKEENEHAGDAWKEWYEKNGPAIP